MIDALMDAPIEDVIALIPFPADMRDALVSRAGDKDALLDCVTASSPATSAARSGWSAAPATSTSSR